MAEYQNSATFCCMNLEECYRLLGLRSGASFADIKASYRRLARQYHPDANPGSQQTQEKFIALTEAYKQIMDTTKFAESATEADSPAPDVTEVKAEPKSKSDPKIKIEVTRPQATVQVNPNLSPLEQDLKRTSYEQLQQHLKQKRFARAIALVEALTQRIPKDPEVRQWQAITYQRWARQLISQNDLEKARIYLKKALRADPHNRTLWAEVEKDFRRLEKKF